MWQRGVGNRHGKQVVLDAARELANSVGLFDLSELPESHMLTIFHVCKVGMCRREISAQQCINLVELCRVQIVYRILLHLFCWCIICALI